MFIAYRVIALFFLLGICFSFELPDLDEVQNSDDNELEKLLASVRLLVTGLKTDIKVQEAKIKNLETNYKSLSKKVGSSQARLSNVERRINGARTTCNDRETAWAPYSGAPIMFLDRQAVTCPQGYFLSRFHLIRQADRVQAPVRYRFRCCKFIL
ncbi:uncharacterized protein LOC116293367 [Actinia tenebrosa]|uniref:Uncharacterized protein LOC116293367 n=1 Tax=Actinia tenebrosa TaxID=6105 RepID=A0A6P8HVM5_ACTTE|nr:uncharacterized protein LOC116293367 [Actinia tenebrosa]